MKTTSQLPKTLSHTFEAHSVKEFHIFAKITPKTNNNKTKTQSNNNHKKMQRLLFQEHRQHQTVSQIQPVIIIVNFIITKIMIILYDGVMIIINIRIMMLALYQKWKDI